MRYTVVAVVGLLAGLVSGGCGKPSAPPAEGGDSSATAGTSAAPAAVPEGWQLQSSLGIEIAVPADWVVNQTSCRGPSGSTILRAPGAVPACTMGGATIEPPPVPDNLVEVTTVQDSVGDTEPPADVVQLEPDQQAFDEQQITAGLAAHHVVVDAAWVHLDVPDEAVARQIIASIRRVDVDHHGCPTVAPERPAYEVALRPAAEPLIGADTEQLAVCSYNADSRKNRLLQASTTLTGSDLRQAIDAVAAAPAGPNPDQADCLFGPPAEAADVSLIPSGGQPVLSVYFAGCSGRGVDDGSHIAQVTPELVELIEESLRTFYVVADLTE